jgi:hypothetical protein
MPRPTPAQLARGVLTVVGSTLALLLLTQARSAAAVALVAVTALALGLSAAVAPGLLGSRRTRGRSLPVAGNRPGTPKARVPAGDGTGGAVPHGSRASAPVRR